MKDQALERELLALLQAGHPDAQERLYRAYYKRLLATAWHVLGYNDTEAEDAVQEAFIQAIKKLPGTPIHTSLYGWLNRICVLRCIDIIRVRQRMLAKQQDQLEALSAFNALDRQRQLGQDEELKDRLEGLRQAIGAMDERCRGLLRDRDIEGLSYIELAGRHKLVLGTVMSRLARCHEALKKKMIRASRWSDR